MHFILKIHDICDYVFLLQVCYYCLRARDKELRPPVMGGSGEPLGSTILGAKALEAERRDSNGARDGGEAPLFCSVSCEASAEVSRLHHQFYIIMMCPLSKTI